MRSPTNRIAHFDVRGIPSTAWHVDVLHTFEQLRDCEDIELVSSHQLRPLGHSISSTRLT